MLSPFECLCRNFILPEICKPCLFIFAKLILPYPHHSSFMVCCRLGELPGSAGTDLQTRSCTLPKRNNSISFWNFHKRGHKSWAAKFQQNNILPCLYLREDGFQAFPQNDSPHQAGMDESRRHGVRASAHLYGVLPALSREPTKASSVSAAAVISPVSLRLRARFAVLMASSSCFLCSLSTVLRISSL